MKWIIVTIEGSGREAIYRIEDINYVKAAVNNKNSSYIYFKDGSYVEVKQSLATIFSILERS